MKCPACGRDIKTYEGFRLHLAREAADYRQRAVFLGDYKNARAEGYEGTPEEYAHGRMAGLLDLLGKDRTKEAADD